MAKKGKVVGVQTLTRAPKPRELEEHDWEKAELAAFAHCTMQEIAAMLEVNTTTLNKAIKRRYGVMPKNWLVTLKAKGDAGLRMAQMASAEGGNTRMLELLGRKRRTRALRQA